VVTVANTPEPPRLSGIQKAAKGVSKANTISMRGSAAQRRSASALQPMNRPPDDFASDNQKKFTGRDQGRKGLAHGHRGNREN